MIFTSGVLPVPIALMNIGLAAVLFFAYLLPDPASVIAASLI